MNNKIEIAGLLEEMDTRLALKGCTDYRDRVASALAALQAEPVAVTDDMAYAFHRALTDGDLPTSDMDEIKAGLRAALANIAPPQPAKVRVPEGHCLDVGHRRVKSATGEDCTCPKYVRHPDCDRHEHRQYLPQENPWRTASPEPAGKVPEVPTKEMCEAFWDEYRKDPWSLVAAYKAMMTAAPAAGEGES